jgi:hypothetical protein
MPCHTATGEKINSWWLFFSTRSKEEESLFYLDFLYKVQQWTSIWRNINELSTDFNFKQHLCNCSTRYKQSSSIRRIITIRIFGGQRYFHPNKIILIILFYLVQFYFIHIIFNSILILQQRKWQFPTI